MIDTYLFYASFADKIPNIGNRREDDTLVRRDAQIVLGRTRNLSHGVKIFVTNWKECLPF